MLDLGRTRPGAPEAGAGRQPLPQGLARGGRAHRLRQEPHLPARRLARSPASLPESAGGRQGLRLSRSPGGGRAVAALLSAAPVQLALTTPTSATGPAAASAAGDRDRRGHRGPGPATGRPGRGDQDGLTPTPRGCSPRSARGWGRRSATPWPATIPASGVAQRAAAGAGGDHAGALGVDGGGARSRPGCRRWTPASFPSARRWTPLNAVLGRAARLDEAALVVSADRRQPAAGLGLRRPPARCCSIGLTRCAARRADPAGPTLGDADFAAVVSTPTAGCRCWRAGARRRRPALPARGRGGDSGAAQDPSRSRPMWRASRWAGRSS